MQMMVMAMEIRVSLFSCALGSATLLRESSISMQSSKSVDIFRGCYKTRK